jgi:hypothetical protein
MARPCSAGSPVLLGGPTPRYRSRGPFGFCLLPPGWSAPRGQSMPRSPGYAGPANCSRSRRWPCCLPLLSTGSAPRIRVLRSSIPGPPMPLSTLRPPPHDDARKTRGQDGSLLLSCRTLSFPTTCRLFRKPVPRPFSGADLTAQFLRRRWCRQRGLPEHLDRVGGENACGGGLAAPVVAAHVRIPRLEIPSLASACSTG